MNNLQNRIAPFVSLGKLLKTDVVEEIAYRAHSQNHWFTPEFVVESLRSIASAYLEEDKLTQWLSSYPSLQIEGGVSEPKKVGVVMAGNLPAVGFHDMLCVLLSGHHLLAKLSADDRVLMLFLMQQLKEADPSLAERMTVVERLNDADAYIATGSDNTSRYFEYYFSKKPNIIRRNRTSVGVLNGTETTDELAAFGRDVLQYFGLGCRSVSKVYVPEGYLFDTLYETIEPKASTYINHHKYFNNYEYNKSVYLVNREPHFDNGFLMMRQAESLVSPISVLFYETYTSASELAEKLAQQADKIQCIVSQNGWFPNSLPLGQAQAPSLSDYADGIDTMAFLTSL